MKKIFVGILTTITIMLAGTAPVFATWQIDIVFSTPNLNSDTGVASNKLTMGTDLTATEGYDSKLDTIALLNGPIHAYVNHPEYQKEYQRLWRDFRKDPLSQEWEIEVLSATANQPIKVSWQIKAPANLSFNLIDKDSSHAIQMASTTEYSYNNPSDTTSKRFLLRVAESQINTTTDDSSATSISTPPPSTSSGGNSSSSSGKGGGCGYIKNAGENDNINGRRQMMLNMIILIAPMLLSFQYRIRHYTFATLKTLINHCKIIRY